MAEEETPIESNNDESPKTVLYEVEHKIATITLNRPEKRNALSWDELDALWEYLKQAIASPSVKIIRIKSNGEKAFCAGLDLNMISSMKPADMPKLIHYGDGIVRTIVQSKKPVIVQVQGVATGWGCILCCASDFVIAADNPEIYFSLPEIEVGIYPATGALTVAYARFGFGLAKQMFLIPQKIPLELAIQKNLVLETVPLENLDTHTFDFCRALVKKSPAILYLTKAVLNRIQYAQIEQYFDWENQAFEQTKTSDETSWDDFVNRLWSSEQ